MQLLTLEVSGFYSDNNTNTWTNWIPYSNIQEYQVILMLLQNERPVYFRNNNNIISFFTDIEDTGP